jgi:hypothetical protein
VWATTTITLRTESLMTEISLPFYSYRLRFLSGQDGEHPRDTSIVGNFIHEVGVWGKQGVACSLRSV